jgi:sec-independent protein translocase protein tatA/E homolog
MSLGLTEIALILVVILVLFGGKRIPELARALGKAQYEYKKAKEMLQNEARELKDSVEKAAADEEKKDQK